MLLYVVFLVNVVTRLWVLILKLLTVHLVWNWYQKALGSVLKHLSGNYPIFIFASHTG